MYFRCCFFVLVPVCWYPHHMRSLWSCCLCLVSCRFWSLLEFGLYFCDRQLEDLLYSLSCRYLYKKPEVTFCYGVHSIKLATKEALGLHHLCRDPICSVQEAFLQGLCGGAQGDQRMHEPDLILQAPSALESILSCRLCPVFPFPF